MAGNTSDGRWGGVRGKQKILEILRGNEKCLETKLREDWREGREEEGE